MNLLAEYHSYRGNAPAHTDRISLSENFRGGDFEDFPCTVSLTGDRGKEEINGELRFFFSAPAAESASVSLTVELADWRKGNYVFAPAAAYDGNRFTSRPLAYPPYAEFSREEALTAAPVVTDIPRLSDREPQSVICFRSGDLSTPAIGFYDDENHQGMLLFGPHQVNGDCTGFTVREDLDKGTASFELSAPSVRENTRYFFGHRGDGFFPDFHAPSDDSGRCFQAEETVVLPFYLFFFQADSLTEFFTYFHSRRECLETGAPANTAPFRRVYEAIKEKYQQENYIAEGDEGYFSVGTDHSLPQNCWQTGWVGGGMNGYAFLLEDQGDARERALKSLQFPFNRLQNQNGWIAGMYSNGKIYGDAFQTQGNSVLLLRKNADFLYFAMKQYLLEQPEGLAEPIKGLAGAFVRLYHRFGQLGQFVNIETGEILTGGTCSSAIAMAGLALAYEAFGEESFLETAEALGELYDQEYLSRGIANGGPGEICQAPDSESAFGLLEGYVQLYETTRRAQWLDCAQRAWALAATWVVSYDFRFPRDSAASRLGVRSQGAVFANVQNKHGAPGICTLSGNSLLKLYRFTGNRRYLECLRQISHCIPQFVSLPERPVPGLNKKFLRPGYLNERVQLSDWEGKEKVGEFINDSNWPEVTMLLTYAEVPGVYVDFASGTAVAFDHVQCKVESFSEKQMILQLMNDSPYDTEVTLLEDDSAQRDLVRHNYFPRMRRIELKSGEQRLVTAFRPSEKEAAR